MNITSFQKITGIALMLLAGSQNLMAQTTDPVAENMLVYQRTYGGWPKALGKEKVNYDHVLSADQRERVKNTANDDDATIDNKATSREIVYLVKAYDQTKNQQYLDAAKRGIDYVLKAQYPNGGWPQYYPDRKYYRAEITYNDDAMINVLNILLDVAQKNDGYAVLGDDYARKAQQSVDKGIDCILKTQFVANGTLTAWAAQYDQNKLTPAKARAFELAALASSESSNVVKFLMRIDHPSKEIITAINSAMAWFDKVKIVGFRADMVNAPAESSGRDRVLVADPSSIIWSRFYDLKTMEPQFCGRDGIARTKLADIENERRVGYAWYGTWGNKLTGEYAKWKKKNGIN